MNHIVLPATMANEEVSRSLWHNALLCCGIVGSILFSVTYFTYGITSPEYDMMRQPIGDLQLLNNGWIQSTNFVVFGLFILAFTFGLSKEMTGGFGSVLIPLTYVISASGMILSGLFIGDPVHDTAGNVAFFSLVTSFFLFARRFALDGHWKGWATCCIIIPITMLLLIAVFVYLKGSENPYAGVFERLVIVTRMVWTIVFVIKLLDGRRLT